MTPRPISHPRPEIPEPPRPEPKPAINGGVVASTHPDPRPPTTPDPIPGPKPQRPAATGPTSPVPQPDGPGNPDPRAPLRFDRDAFEDTLTDPVRIKPKRLGTIMSLRLTPDLFEKVSARADRDGLTLSEFVRRIVLGAVSEPIGYQCDHLNITGPAGVVSEPSAWCGCRMQPVYDPKELRHAAA